MPWTQTDTMEQRTRFVFDYKDGLFSVPELCERYGITRKTGYKWIRRYKADGLRGLEELSRRPNSCPHQTAPEIEQLLVACRKKHPFWGPEKLIDRLSRRHKGLDWPAKSTIGAIIARHGLVKPRKRRKSSRHPGAPPLNTTAPNEVWSADFKGQFKMRNGVYNFPLTITDSHSRLILCCKGLPTTEQISTEPEFTGSSERRDYPTQFVPTTAIHLQHAHTAASLPSPSCGLNSASCINALNPDVHNKTDAMNGCTET